MPTFEFGGEIAWRPSPEVIERSRLTAFMRRHQLPSFAALLERSTADPEWFWPAVFDDLGLEFYEPFRQVLDVSKGPAWARWCVGARLNIARPSLYLSVPAEIRAEGMAPAAA